MSIITKIDRRRFQGGAGLFSTVEGVPLVSQYVGLGAHADEDGTTHFTIGACRSAEGNSFVKVLDIDVSSAVVRILGQQLIVP
jgi:hypothetical protein